MISNPVISIILGSYNRLPFLKATIKNIREHGIRVPYELIVVDGGSTDGAMQWLTKQKDIITIIQHNRGAKADGTPIERRSWGYFMNLAFKAAQGKYALMLSDDCLLIPGAVMNAYDEFEEMLAAGKKVGGLAFYWRNWPDTEKYWVTQLFDDHITMINHGLFYLPAMQEVGWIDEDTYMFYCADADLACRLLQAGYPIFPCETAFVEHRAHVNHKIRVTNASFTERDFDAFYKRWNGIYYRDGGIKGSLHYTDFTDPQLTVNLFPKDPASEQPILTMIKRILPKPVIERLGSVRNYFKAILSRLPVKKIHDR